MILKFQGKVQIIYNPIDVIIGNTRIMYDIESAFRNKQPVTVAIADQELTQSIVNGTLDIDTGMEGYSEWTPGYPSNFTVGGHDILKRLQGLEYTTITLWVADEPFNILE